MYVLPPCDLTQTCGLTLEQNAIEFTLAFFMASPLLTRLHHRSGTMTTEGIKYKLSAILSADDEGYGRLMDIRLEQV